MLYDVLKDRNYANLMQKHILEILTFLFETEQNFGILCKIETLTFDPELPTEITTEFRPMTLFFLAGYTFESARMENDRLIFEAGFGPDNLGSIVTVPLLGIMQVIIDETPIFVNLASPLETNNTKAKNNESEKSGVKSSMEALLANPENKKFLK
jgi:hypothetical protein